MDIEKIRRALEAARYEFTTLSPRLTVAYRANAIACKVLCDEALAELPPKQPTVRELCDPAFTPPASTVKR